MKFFMTIVTLTMFSISYSFAGDFIYQPDPDTGKDTMLNRSSPDQNYGARPNIYALTASNCNDSGNIILIQFDLSSLPNNSKEVYLGFTHLPKSYCYSNCQLNYYFYPVLEAWDEMKVTYNTKPDIDFNKPLFGPITLTVPNDYGTKEYNITNIYRAWKDGSLENHGLAIYSPDGGCNNAAVTFSVYSSDEDNATRRPYLRFVSDAVINRGDQNGDGQINIVDALLVARCAVKLNNNCSIEQADVDCNGAINIIDALLIARRSVNLPTPTWCNTVPK